MENTLRIVVDPYDIAYIRYTIEAYEGLCILTSLDSKRGILQISYPKEQEEDLKSIIKALSFEIQLKIENNLWLS